MSKFCRRIFPNHQILNLILLLLFAIGSLSVHVPKFRDLKAKFDNGKTWVVLVAGSSGWSNYRHQADICHAYQILRGNGIPKDNIITMMVDDIANNTRNPTLGQIVNQPNGMDVYKGVIIDYKGTDVNSTNFLNVITGKKEAMQSVGTGKVIKGGHNDRIFINFVDHGATGILGFPDDYLYADQLNEALNTMYASKSYKKMLLYIEACHAGSMFDGIISENSSIMAVTASGPRENSMGCYCKSQSGPYGTCLGDLFSATWMENVDEVSDAKKKTVFNNFNTVRTKVTESNVMAYGDFNTGHEKLSAFIGYRKTDNKGAPKLMSKIIKKKITVSSRNVYENTVLHQLTEKSNRLKGLRTHQIEMEILQNNKMRLIIDKVFRMIYSKIVRAIPKIKNEIGELDAPKNLDLSLDMFPCYRSILNKITESCFSLPRNPYLLDRLTIFANLCVVDKYAHKLLGKLIDESCLETLKHIHNVY